jgi:tetratricopeptide (TPR) repeat protein
VTAGPVLGEGGHPVSPLRDLPFVGRETALAALVSAVQAAEVGEQVLGLVTGEPGIGKTRLVEELAARVSSRVLWGTCWEGDGAPPYWVWLQLLRALGSAQDAQPGASEDELHALLGEAGSADATGDARFRLFDAVTEVFSQASERRPLVLVLEDLHWADEASIRLLEFLGRDRRPRRLAVIGTYRDTDLDHTRPLARRLAELVRDGVHLSLGGLAKRDVSALVAAVGGEDGLQWMVPVLHRKSGGNPLFLREVVRLWRDEGRLGGTSSDPAALPSAVPAGIRPVVARRLGKLTQSTQRVLAAAAVAGTGFDVALLATVLGLPAPELLDALDEARVAGLVTASSTVGSFTFVHALVREVLYEGLSLTARAALHSELADAIEQRFGDARLPEIAHHVLQGAVAGGDDRAFGLAVRAGDRSFGALAYEEAAAWYRRALDVLPASGRRDGREADLLIRQGEAHLAAGDIPAARDAYQHAAVLAGGRGDAEQLARAALGLGAGFGGFEVKLFDPVQVELLEEALAALDARPSPLRAWVLARLSVALSFVDGDARRLSLSEEAVAMARQVGDESALGYALAGHCDAIPGPDHCETRLAEATEVVCLARAAGDRPLELLGRRLRLVALMELGEVGAADAEIDRFAQVADQVRQPLYRWYVPLWRGMRDLMRGETAAAARQCTVAHDIGVLAHSDNARMLTFTQWWVRQRYEGRFADADRAMAELFEPGSGRASLTPAGWPYPAVVAAQLGERERARVLLEQWLATGLERRPRDSEWLPDSAQLAQVAVLAGCREVAELLYEQLRPYAHRFCIEGIGAAFTGSVAWYLALLARFLERADEAGTYARQARAAHRRVGLVGDPPPLAGAGPAPGPAPAPPGGSAPTAVGTMTWEGATWAVTYAGATCRLRDSKGVRDSPSSWPAPPKRCTVSSWSAVPTCRPAPARSSTSRPGAPTNGESGTCRATSTRRGPPTTRFAPSGPRRSSTPCCGRSPRRSACRGGRGLPGRRPSGPDRPSGGGSERRSVRPPRCIRPWAATCRTACTPGRGARTGRSRPSHGRSSTTLRGAARRGGRTRRRRRARGLGRTRPPPPGPERSPPG